MREHAKQYPTEYGDGVWRYVLPQRYRYERRVVIVFLSVTTLADYERYSDAEWTPCDQEGNPLSLLTRVAYLEETRDVNIALVRLAHEQTARAEHERDAERARADKAEANYRWMVEHAADQRLDGYRELAAKVATAEEERDKLRHELSVIADEFGIATGQGHEALRKAISDWREQQRRDQEGPDDE